jgi:ATP-binding cassette subfamily B protein
LRVAFQEKIPRLSDRYFHSRLTSDMAERNHSLHNLRWLPTLGGDILRNGFELLLTLAGILWLIPERPRRGRRRGFSCRRFGRFWSRGTRVRRMPER